MAVIQLLHTPQVIWRCRSCAEVGITMIWSAANINDDDTEDAAWHETFHGHRVSGDIHLSPEWHLRPPHLHPPQLL